MSEMSELTDYLERSSSERAELKQERLQYTVEYAYEHSPFYRDLLDDHDVEPRDVRTFSDLESLPVVTERDVREAQTPGSGSPSLRTHRGDLHRPVATSAFVDRPKLFYKTHDEIDSWTAVFGRFLGHADVSRSELIVNYCPYERMNAGGLCTETTFREYGYSTLPLLTSDMDLAAEAYLIGSHEVGSMVTFPSHAQALGLQLLDAGYDPTDLGIDTLMLSGEPFSGARREAIAELWDATVYDLYGLAECGIVGGECGDPGTRQLHVFEDKTYVEVTDDGGRRLDPGELGHLTVTNLLEPGTDSAMPLLRYRPGDLTAVSESECDCELHGQKRIEQPIRESWVVRVGDATVGALDFEEQIFGHPAVEDLVSDYEVHVDTEGDRDRVTALVVTRNDVHAGERASDVTTEDVDGVAAAIGRSFLTNHAGLREAVETTGAVRLDVDVVEEIDHEKGKRDRLVDGR